MKFWHMPDLTSIHLSLLLVFRFTNLGIIIECSWLDSYTSDVYVWFYSNI